MASTPADRTTGVRAPAAAQPSDAVGAEPDVPDATGPRQAGGRWPPWPPWHGVFRLVERIVFWSDSAIRIPGTRFRVGLDPIVGLLFPGAGDAAGGLVSLSVVLLALRYRLPVWVVARMVWNLALDAAVGSVPLVGDVFDFGFRANQRNMALLHEHRERASPAAMPVRYWLWAGALMAGALALACIPLVLSVWLISSFLGGR